MRLPIFVLLFTSLAFIDAHAGFIGSPHYNGFNYQHGQFGSHGGHDSTGFNPGGQQDRFCGDIIEFYSGHWHTVNFSHGSHNTGSHFTGHSAQNSWPVLSWYDPLPYWPFNWLDPFKPKHGIIFDFDHDWSKKHRRHWHKANDHHHDDDDRCQWNCTTDPSFPPTSLNNVPEPGTFALLLVSSMMLMFCKNRYLPATVRLGRNK